MEAANEQSDPIVVCLAELRAQWTRFVGQAGTRLLVWRAADEEEPFIDAFVAQECEPTAAETPDLFLQLSSPFTGELEHADKLADELAALFAQAPGPRPERGATPDHALRSRADIAALVRALSSLRAALAEGACGAVLAVWLTPDAVSSWQSYLLWLQRLLQQAPGTVRFLVVERTSAPRYALLAESAPERVIVQPSGLAVFAAIEQLTIDADRGSHDGKFRRLQAQLAARLGADDLAGARSTGAAALAVALEQGWPQLAAVVQMTLAGAYSAADKPHEAILAYAEAERMGALSEERERNAHTLAGLPAYGAKIRLHACLGQAAVWLASRAYQGAAIAYEQSARVAHGLGDACAELDAYRMASKCHAALCDAEAAWQRGMQGLRVSLTMDSETRQSSSLADLAAHLRSLTRRYRVYSAHRGPLEAQLATLLQPAVPNNRSGKGVRDE